MKRVIYLAVIAVFLLIPLVLQAQEQRMWILLNHKPKFQSINTERVMFLDEELRNMTNTLSIDNIKQVFPYSRNDTLLRLFEIKVTNEQANAIASYPQIEEFYFPSEEENIELYNPSDYMWYLYYSDSTSWLWHLKTIMADQAWDITKGDTNIKIAILDTWFDINHPDLINKFYCTYDPYDNQPFYTDGTRHNHGTAVASFAAAETDGGGQLASVGFNCRIIPYKAWNGNYLERAHHASLAMHADVLTSSAGGWSCDRNFNNIEKMAVKEILNNGTVIVMPAGNGNQGTHCYSSELQSDQPFRPLHPYYDDRIIIVTSTTKEDLHHNGVDSSHSHYSEVDICAPGYDIMGAKSTVDQFGNPEQWPYFGKYGGTSFSTPIVAGTCALIKSVNKCLTPADIEEIIKTTADPVQDEYLYPGLLGAGRLNAYEAVTMAQDYHNGDTISTNTLWASNTFYKGNIVVMPGSTLTVTGTIHLDSTVRIIVLPGGKLVVDGGTLTSACDCFMWKGIEVVGDRTKHQEPQYQGVVELKNGAVIENAITAIRTGLRDEDWHTTGGIITATNTVFKNNQRSLEFLSYCDTDSAANLLNNCSYFVGCTFTIDTNNVLAQNNRQFTNHVTMWDVKNVRFKGCTFENKMNRGRLCEGKGIATIDAGFSLTTYPFPYATYSGGGSFLPDTFLFNTFTGFYTAVEVTTTGNQYAVKLDETKFNNNQQAISVYGNNHVEVIRCDVNQTDYKASMVYQRKGISLENSTGYHIEKNQFYDYYYSPSSQSNNSKYGIKITNSGTNNNRIYKNDFTKMANGILVSGTNGNVKRGLQFICNNFSTNDYDIRLMHYATIAPCQGQINSGADNNFSGTYDYNIYNSSLPDITYLYSSSNPAHYPSLAYHVTPLSNGISTNPCYSTIFDINLNRTDYNTSDLAAMVSAYQELDSARVSQLEMTEEGTYNTSPVSPEMMALQQEASDLYYKAVRQIMLDSLTDMATLAEWHATASVFADPYSWSETMYQMNETAEYASIVTDDTAERDNYAAFRALKSECASLTTEKGVNWYAMSEEQIERLIRIAELNTGRTSVMAKGILCFFFNICYEDVDETINTRSAICQGEGLSDTLFESVTKTKYIDEQENTQESNLVIYPNPTNQTFSISFSEAQESVKQVRIINMQGKVVLSQENPSNNVVNIANLPVGMYVVRVLGQSGKEYAVKLVKE